MEHLRVHRFSDNFVEFHVEQARAIGWVNERSADGFSRVREL
ncbi:hypothetical protein BZL29_1238 [Mycobacterium kansasii]|uniref:Uncharacterized protein n=1 Tax=Mycobacterium kansasii TaxID=1768 RepID=A0A1V3XZ85_MYCKA|nr:hypothetical protein BZL29_1238 [Mycobacterium kansasii]